MEGPDDRLQHVDRGWRQGRPHRSGRDDLRVPEAAARMHAPAATGHGTRLSTNGKPSSTPTKMRSWDREIVLDGSQRSRRMSPGARTPARSHRSTSPIPLALRFRQRDHHATDRRAEHSSLHGRSPPARQLREVAVDTVFIGSCTNSRIEDLRARRCSDRGGAAVTVPRVLVVPGSHAVQAIKRSKKDSTRSSPRQEPTGVSRAARCAWR